MYTKIKLKEAKRLLADHDVDTAYTTHCILHPRSSDRVQSWGILIQGDC
jgi:hypothetical protein